MFTGACAGLRVGESAVRLVPFSILALTLFWLRTPVESWAGTAAIRPRTQDELQFVRRTTLALAGVAVLAVVWLLWRGENQPLIWIGVVAGTAFLLQSALKRVWRGARTTAQMVGAAGLTATAPAAYYVVSSRLDMTAWSLWAANLLFAVNQIHYVHLRIQTAHATTRSEKFAAGRGFIAGQFALIGILCFACALQAFPWYAVPAFLPVLFRGFAWFKAEPQPLAVQKLGKSELFLAIAFGVLLVAGMMLH